MKVTSEIESLKEADIAYYAEILAHSYPRPTEYSTEKRMDFIKNTLLGDNNAKYYAAFRNLKMVGSMKFFDFQMNIRNYIIPTIGLSALGVHPINRKEGVGNDLMEFYLKENDALGYNMLILYPFNLSFYRKMGFGYGTKHRLYKLDPKSFPGGKTDHLIFLNEEDEKDLHDFYDNYFENTHGMISNKELISGEELNDFTIKIVGYKKDGIIEGYLMYEIKREKPQNTFDCFIHIYELVYNSKEALQELLSFIHAQKDQADRVHLKTQDEYLFYLLEDPLNGTKENFDTEQLECYTTALSMMYRVINTSRLFEEFGNYQFGTETVTVKLNIDDSFFPKNSGSTIVAFKNGYPKLYDDTGEHHVEVSMKIQDFSSLFVGAVPFEKLIEYGLAEISDPGYIDTISRTLNYHKKPMCFADF